MEGYGEYSWIDGRKYIGFYKEDKKEGFGIYYWNENKIFIGFWKEGEHHGLGKMLGSKKNKVGYWEKGKKKYWIDTKQTNQLNLKFFDNFNSGNDILEFFKLD